MGKLSLVGFRNKSFMKIVSVILLQAFILSNPSFAAADIGKSAARGNPSIDKISPQGIIIPKNIGSVKDRHEGTSGKLVVHIQDAHCNYEAQSNIARILEHVIKKYNIGLVAVEGADGVVDTTWFRAFPDPEIRRQVADYFMKKGDLTGTEFLSITKDYSFTIYGVEDRKEYTKNLTAFLESYPHRESFKKFYTGVKKALAKLKRFIYTKELLELDRAVTDHEKGKSAFKEYARYLEKLSASKNLEKEKYGNFGLLLKALELEDKIDFDTVNGERASLIDELSKKLSKNELSGLVDRSVKFRNGKVVSDEFHLYLGKLAEKNKIDLPGKYKNLAIFIEYSEVYAGIDNEKLFEELDSIVRALKERMFASSDQRTLDGLWANVKVMLGFAELELMNKEYEYYLANRPAFRPGRFTDFINRKSENLGLTFNIEKAPPKLGSAFSKFISFYETGMKRDRILVKNMFNGMRGKKTDAAVLVTGGFHTKGIKKLLEKEGASYVVVCPAITEDIESPYVAVLTGQKAPFARLAMVTPAELGAPYMSDHDILAVLKNARLSEEARGMVAGTLARRRYNLAVLADIYADDFIRRHPRAEDAGLLRINMFAALEIQCASAPHDGNVKRLRARLRSDEGRDRFNTFYAHRSPETLTPVVIGAMRGGEFTPVAQFEAVEDVLWERAPLLALKLEELRELADEKDPEVIRSAVSRAAEDDTERGVLELAFFTSTEGGVGGNADETTLMKAIWEKEPSIWEGFPKNDVVKSRIVNWMGWLHAPRRFANEITRLRELAEKLQHGNVVVLGTGGSGRAPRTLGQIFKRTNLIVSYSPQGEEIQDIIGKLNENGGIANTVFFVSSKTGGTTEPLMQEAIFRDILRELKKSGRLKDKVSKHFYAITDEGTDLHDRKERGEFEDVFLNNKTQDNENREGIGGRFSALSFFGLAPLAASGVDVEEILKNATDEEDRIMSAVASGNTDDILGFRLATELEKFRQKGFEHIVQIPEETTEVTGPWTEQLYNETLTKKDDAPLWVYGEPLLEGEAYYGKNVIFIRPVIGKERGVRISELNGRPLIEVKFQNVSQLILNMELAVTVWAYYLRVNPFIQESVNNSKDITKEFLVKHFGSYSSEKDIETKLLQLEKEGQVLEDGETITRNGIKFYFAGKTETAVKNGLKKSGKTIETATVKDLVDTFVGTAKKGDYIGLFAYTNEDDRLRGSFNGIRGNYKRNLDSHPTTLFDFGPGFHHSNNVGITCKDGVILLITFESEDHAKLPIFGKPYNTDQLIRAMVVGELRSLQKEKGRNREFTDEGTRIERRVMRLHLPREYRKDLGKLEGLLSVAPVSTEHPGGAVTVDGRALTDEQKTEVDMAIRYAFEARIAFEKAELVDTVNGVEIYNIPSLEALSYLVAHPGRGGEACSHTKRRIYLSPSRVAWFKSLPQATQNQFMTHEIAHLDNPADEGEAADAYEARIQKIAPIDRVLAETAVSETLPKVVGKIKGELEALKRDVPETIATELDATQLNEAEGYVAEAAYGIAAYFSNEFQNDNIELKVYTETMPECVYNVAYYLLNPGIEDATKEGLINAINQGRWEDIASSYDTLVAFGTAGVRTSFVKGSDDFELIADAADEGRGLGIPILRGPNTINPEIVKKFTLAMLKWKAEQSGATTPEDRKKIRVGIARDCRIAGGEFVDKIMRKICLSFGVTLYIADEPMPLPEFSCAFNEHKIDFGLYVSASHNGKIFNGLKVIGPGGMQMGADEAEREEVLAQFRETSPREAQLYIERYPQTDVSADQVIIMGGTERISPDEVRDVTDSDYDKYKLVDTHTNHAEAVMEKVDAALIGRYGPELNIGYCAFYGVGRKATPRMLRELGVTNFDIIERMNRLDGRFPGLTVPDPGLAAGWEEALQIYEEDNDRGALLEKDFWLSNDPDADRFGLVIRVSADEIPGDDEIARAMGIAVKLTDEEQKHYGYAGLRVIPANEWGSLITSYDLQKMAENQGGEIQNPGGLLVALSHVTSGLVPAIAEKHGVNSEILSVGVDRLAVCIKERENEGINVVSGVEESGTYTTGNHILDKDGFLAAMRITELACAARQGKDKKTLNELLDELYLRYGLYATTNNYMEFDSNVPERARRINVMSWFKDVLFEEARKRAQTDNPIEIAGLKIYGADMQEKFKTGKYDKITFDGFPDGGIRFYLDRDKKTHITVRPSGTEPKIRFYVQIYDGDVKGKSREFLAERKKTTYAKALQLTKEFMTIANTSDMEVVDMLGRVEGAKNAAGITVATVGNSTLEHLAIMGNRAIGRLTIRSIDDVFANGDLDKLTGGKPYRLLVRKRSLIEEPECGSLLVQGEGMGNEGRTLEDKYGNSAVVATREHNLRMRQVPTREPHEVVAYIEYEPSEAETIVMAGSDAMKENAPLLKGVLKGEGKPIMLHVPRAPMYLKNSFIEAKKAWDARCRGAVSIRAYGTAADSLKGLKGRTWNPAYTHVFVMCKDDLSRITDDTKAGGELGAKLSGVLKQRILPVERPPSSEAEWLAFRQETEIGAVTLALTNDNEVGENEVKGHGLVLQDFMRRLTGKAVEPNELRSLFGISASQIADDATAIHSRINMLITRLLIPARPVTEGVRDFIRARRALGEAV